MEDFLLFTVPITSTELLAASLGLYYTFKREVSKPIKYFAYFLCLTVFVEIVAYYAPLGGFSGYELFGFVEGTRFEENYWIYNIFMIVNYLAYALFFRAYLTLAIPRKIILFLCVVFVLSSMLNLLTSNIFFIYYSSYTTIFGSLLVLCSIACYYYQLLTSDAILEILRSFPFYVAIGAILLNVILTPLFIYSRFFSQEISPEFVETYKILLITTNVLVYLIYAFGFTICLRKKSS